MKPINLQALIALFLFFAALAVARTVINIYKGRWPGGEGVIMYMRVLLGFLMAASITLAYYAFAGKDIISGRIL